MSNLSLRPSFIEEYKEERHIDTNIHAPACLVEPEIG
jgi:hypothetical protein